MSGLPLADRSVVVTRTRSQASQLAERLTALGAEVVELPVIAIEDPVDGGEALAGAVGRLLAGRYGWVALTSSNAVSRLVAALGDRAVPGRVRWAAVGPGTARTLEAAGLPVDLVPATSRAEAVAQAFPSRPAVPPGAAADTAGQAPPTVLFPRAETVRDSLASGLRAKGWVVDEVVAYRTVAGKPSPEAVHAAGRAHGVAFTASSTVTRTVDLLGSAGVPPVVVTIGPATTEAARSVGLEVAAEADPHTIDGLVEAVVATLGHPTPPGRDRLPGTPFDVLP